MTNFTSKRPHYEYLRKKWVARQRVSKDNFWNKHSGSLKQLAFGSLGGLMLFLPVPSHAMPPHLLASKERLFENFDKNILLAEALSQRLPKDVRPLDANEEQEITDTLTKYFGMKVTAIIDGIKLNRNYGLIGGEQHLYRYPGDNLYAHADNSTDYAKYSGAGIASGLGAWGYFASSLQEFQDIDRARERYYLAMQTFLVPGYAENVTKFRDFFKFRKMLVINPKTGQAVVAVIGDAGPADWTGKHLGGSPEVMDALELAGGSRKGPVLYFFIDDPEDLVPLGPIKVQTEM